MSNNNKQTLNILGFIAVLGMIWYIVKLIRNRTETKLYSDQAYEDIQDKEKLKKLNKYIDDYHQNGEWDPSLLK